MLTASIVLYKTQRAQIVDLIQCVVGSKCVARLYLVDNSPDDSLKDLQDMDPSIEYIFNNANVGYGAAHNVAIRKALESASDYHVVLNPDIRFGGELFASLIGYMDKNPDVVYMLPRVIYPDGRIQRLCKLLPTPFNLIARRFLPKTKWVERLDALYTLREFGYDRIINPPCLSGCFMFLRLSVMSENNILFDDRYFMYCEDFDLIRRLHRYGRTIYYPEAQIIHDHAQASYHSVKMTIQHIKSACRYFNKYGWFFDKERKQMNRQILREINGDTVVDRAMRDR